MSKIEINFSKINEAKMQLNSNTMNTFVTNRIQEYSEILNFNSGDTCKEILCIPKNLEKINQDVQKLYGAINIMLSAIITVYKEHDEATAAELKNNVL